MAKRIVVANYLWFFKVSHHILCNKSSVMSLGMIGRAITWVVKKFWKSMYNWQLNFENFDYSVVNGLFVEWKVS